MLVIHPKDPSTDFLKVLYEGLKDVRLIDEYTTTKEMRHALNHVRPGETVMLFGHGCTEGLFAQEKNGYKLINMHSFSFYLRRHFVVGVFCYANKFAEKERLRGLFTGMIISEQSEADAFGIKTSQEELDRENVKFAKRLRQLFDERCPVYDIPRRIGAMDDAHTELTNYNYSSVYSL